MTLYFAPMEGITGYIFRNAHHAYFKGVDKYFTPFVMPNQNRGLGPRDIQDVEPSHNQGIPLVPQILTNKSAHFLCAVRELHENYGYEEVNLNLGCPSRTVVTKGKGAGFLRDPEALNRFLDEIFARASVKISIKTRLGMEKPEEFYTLMDIFNQYPVHELILHPRVQTDYYKNTPNREMFREALRLNKQPQMPVCYNGDLFTPEQYTGFHREFPDTDHIMLGRGLLVNPALAEQIRFRETSAPGEDCFADAAPAAAGSGFSGSIPDAARLRAFHDRIYYGYRELLSGDTPVLFKMKELWLYMSHSFPKGDQYLKKLQKASRSREYEEAVNRIFDSL